MRVPDGFRVRLELAHLDARPDEHEADAGTFVHQQPGRVDDGFQALRHAHVARKQDVERARGMPQRFQHVFVRCLASRGQRTGPVVHHVDFALRHPALHEPALEARREDDELRRRPIHSTAPGVHQGQNRPVADHPRSRQRVRPQILDVIHERRLAEKPKRGAGSPTVAGGW